MDGKYSCSIFRLMTIKSVLYDFLGTEVHWADD